VKAKPFNTSFDKQVTACWELYGKQLQINVTKQDINKSLLDGFTAYPLTARSRIIQILHHQLERIS